ncbi:putative NRPS-like enzyme [Aspergillus homomorphus CBS 101889]|uniref:NRPS-like enzyme n=1 Tax=Aspergillus homomorphus (strain CBS 101889) TaxID=1450537 RepID=A0A395HRY9_ASPHC|nr:NRPS-like enzyme [Aspergillus homomorphus CBS 101889]RAL10259.1 NRPS-like enzyme [Aspergillus homomorphus CBS 101889]
MADQPGARLWPVIVDHRAQSAPTELVGLIPKGSDVAAGYEELTFAGLARAVDACARWIEARIGRAKQPETIAYMASNDVRYLVFLLASHKTGYQPLLPSTRLSDEAYKHILTATKCQKFFYTPDKQRRVSEIQTVQPDTKLFEVPSLVEFLETDSSPYPFEKTFKEAEDEVAIIIHSSGTTGMPKPVPLTHGFLATLDIGAYISRPEGRRSALFNDLQPGQLVLSTTPLFHLMGLIAFCEALFHETPFVMCPDKPLSVDTIVDVIHATHPTAALFPPSILEEISHSPSARAALKTLEAVYFAGAPLAPEVGDALEADTKVITLIGSSEMGVISSFVPQGEKVWGYFEWNPAYGVEMQPQGDGLYELVIPRRGDSRRIHGIFHTFPHLNKYHTNDLFARHPERPNLWKYHGRKDDVLVLSNGEKLNPVTLEKTVEGHPRVKHALVVGQGRFETALLVEPNAAVADETEFVDAIWPTVERANETVPKYGRVSRNKIRLASPAKPFTVTPKGTTQRRAVNSDYKDEIDAIYAAAAAEEAASVPQLPATLDLEHLRDYVRRLLADLLARSDLKDDEDLYGAGLDSLQTIHLARTLQSAVATLRGSVSVNQQQIYAHPTVAQLAQYLVDLIHGQTSTTSISRPERIANMITKYTSQLPAYRPLPAHLPAKSTVILTGSTGSLGTYLLHRLLTNQSIAKVYCFNRSDSAASRQHESFTSKGLDAALLTDPNRVEFLTVSFGAPHFGLADTVYTTLQESVDLIVHNAWKVNFNHPLESFEDPHLRGVLEFLRFSSTSTYRAHLAFVSSVSTIGNWTPEMGAVVPETPVEDVAAVLEQGYGESKHVSERLCVAAARVSGVPTTVLRVGQIGGPTTVLGKWNVDEWVPNLVKTSVAMGKVPADLGGYKVDWVPVDTLATITVELTQTRRREQTHDLHAVYHLVNPHKTAWEELVPALQEKYPHVQTVAFETWLRELEAVRSPSEEEVRAKPALKLLDFYRGLSGSVLSAEIAVEMTRQGSETMARLGGVTAQLMRNWLDQWAF